MFSATRRRRRRAGVIAYRHLPAVAAANCRLRLYISCHLAALNLYYKQTPFAGMLPWLTLPCHCFRCVLCRLPNCPVYVVRRGVRMPEPDFTRRFLLPAYNDLSRRHTYACRLATHRITLLF